MLAWTALHSWECDQRETSNGRSFLLWVNLTFCAELHTNLKPMQEQVFHEALVIHFYADIPDWSQPTTHLPLFGTASMWHTLWSTKVFDPLLISQFISILSYVIYYFSQYFLSHLRLNIAANICCSLWSMSSLVNSFVTF